jgi:RNA polymerase sigma-70 factor (ECF subfamily)
MAVLRDITTGTSLIRSLKAADGDAWRRMAELYGPLVYAWCRQAGLNESDIADTAQNVFLSVFQHVDRFHREGPDDSFRGWLWRITRNEILMLVRRRANQPQAPGGTDAQRTLQQVPEFLASDDSPSTTGTRTMLVRLAVRSLREEFQEATWQAFWRTAVDGQPAPAVADELGMTPIAVRQAKHRVLKRLRDYLAED